MRHGKKFNHLGRTADHRKAMLANLSISLIEHKRITTTVAKAKALKKYVEPEAVKTLFGEVAQKVGDRPGGYTRVIKIGPRQGDGAEMAFIELVDFDENMAKAPKAEKKTRRSRRSSSKAQAAPAAEEAPKTEEKPAEAPVEAPAEEAAAEEAKAE